MELCELDELVGLPSRWVAEAEHRDFLVSDLDCGMSEFACINKRSQEVPRVKEVAL